MIYCMKLTKDVPPHLRLYPHKGWERWTCHFFFTGNVRHALEHFDTLDTGDWDRRVYRGKCDQCDGCETEFWLIDQEQIDAQRDWVLENQN